MHIKLFSQKRLSSPEGELKGMKRVLKFRSQSHVGSRFSRSEFKSRAPENDLDIPLLQNTYPDGCVKKVISQLLRDIFCICQKQTQD